MTARYRVRQFLQAACAWFQPLPSASLRRSVQRPVTGPQGVDSAGCSAAGYEGAGCYLPPAALKLFKAMPRYDRRHGYAVMRALQEEGHLDPALMAAALLHDVGKTAVVGGKLTLWHRVLVVLMEALSPGLVGRIGQNRPGGWRQPFHVQQRHAEIGAELARRAGCSDCTVELIRGHEDPPRREDDPQLAALKRADNLS